MLSVLPSVVEDSIYGSIRTVYIDPLNHYADQDLFSFQLGFSPAPSGRYVVFRRTDIIVQNPPDTAPYNMFFTEVDIGLEEANIAY